MREQETHFVFRFFDTVHDFTQAAAMLAPKLAPFTPLELTQFWLTSPQSFVAAALEADPSKRAILVLKWYLASLRLQAGDAGRTPGKPIDPVLGEHFVGWWDGDEATGRTDLAAEQVAQNPTILAYHVSNALHGVSFEGYHEPKIGISSKGIRMQRIGQAVYRLDKWNEDYLISLPTVHIEGLLTGRPKAEMDGKGWIVCSNGWVTEITYSGKGWLGGQRNSFKGIVFNADDKGNVPRWKVEGVWQGGTYSIVDEKEEATETVDTARDLVRDGVQVKTLAEQDQLESRKLWGKVIDAINRGDSTATNREKSKVEEAARNAIGQESIWKPRHFGKQGEWKAASNLSQKVDGQVAREGQSSWRRRV